MYPVKIVIDIIIDIKKNPGDNELIFIVLFKYSRQTHVQAIILEQTGLSHSIKGLKMAQKLSSVVSCNELFIESRIFREQLLVEFSYYGN